MAGMNGRKSASNLEEENNLDRLKREHFLKPDSDQIDLNLLLKAVLDISDRLDRDKEEESREQKVDRKTSTEQETTRSTEKTVDFDKRSVASSTSSRPKSSRRFDGPKRAAPTERKNMSFSNNKVIDIDRENQRLLKKITTTARGRPKSASSSTSRSFAEPMRVQTASEVNRSRFQRRVDEENQKILSRLQAIKPTPALSKDFLSKEAAAQKRFCTNASKVVRPSSASRPSSARSTRSTRSRMTRASSESSLVTTSDMASVASTSISRASSASRRSRRKRDFPKAVWEPGW